MAPMQQARIPNQVLIVARSFVAAAAFAYAFDLFHQTQNHLTSATGRPFGDDFINYWSGAFLTLHGRAAEVYDVIAFHAFGRTVVGPALDGYHYSYPPVALLMSAPLALVPYVPALFVWLSASWYAFYRSLRLALPNGGALLLALAAPAVLVNAVGGQNGCLTAGLFGGGLGLLARRPYLAGAMLGLLIYKPHLGILIPVALVAGRQWRAFAAATVTVCLLLGASVLLFGADIWALYARNATVLRHVILEDNGVVTRMVSIFIAARSLGASVATAYAAQAVFAALACIAVAIVWFRDTPAYLKNAVLLLGTCLAVPYLQDYDLVFGALVVAWLWQVPVESDRSERALQIACGLVLLLPLVAAAFARLTGIVFGPLFILPAFAIALRAAFATHAAKAPLPASRQQI